METLVWFARRRCSPTKLFKTIRRDYNYQNEQDRFGEAGRAYGRKLQSQAVTVGTWYVTVLIELDFTINPTLGLFTRQVAMQQTSAMRSGMRTIPCRRLTLGGGGSLNQAAMHMGSYWFDWTTEHEVAWRENYRLWMTFLNDYKNHGGRVTTGSDAGYIYKIYGFGFIQELELFREAGFNPLEVLRRLQPCRVPKR